MGHAAIDDLDRRLLALLREDGRLTNQELAELVGLSPSQCSRRRIALEQAGLILSYQAHLSPEADGSSLLGLIEVRLARHAPDAAEALVRYVAQEPAIRDAFKVTGDHDFLLKVGVASLAELNDLLGRLSALGGAVDHLRTAVVLERIKENGRMLPVGG